MAADRPIGTVLYAVYLIMTPVLSRTDSTETAVFYSNVVGFVGMTRSHCRSCGRRRRTRSSPP